MKSKDLLKVIGNMDDELIQNAEIKADNKESKVIKLGKKKEISFKSFGKWAGAIAAILAICVIGGTMFGTMGGAAKMAEQSYAPEGLYNYTDNQREMFLAKAEGSGFAYDTSETKLDTSIDSIKPAQSKLTATKSVKMVYTADLNLQTTEYDKTVKDVQSLVERLGGYFEETSVNNGGMYSSSYNRHGYYVARIPAENYQTFIGQAGEIGYVVSLGEKADNIGQQYFETESRIETLKIKEERLHELLEQATNMSDIISIESELSNVEYELGIYGTQLNRYDSLVDYATINISIEEVSAYSGSNIQKENFGTRFARALKGGLIGFANALDDFGIWIGYNLIGIIVVVAIIFVVCKFHLIRRLIRKITGRQ